MDAVYVMDWSFQYPYEVFSITLHKELGALAYRGSLQNFNKVYPTLVWYGSLRIPATCSLWPLLLFREEEDDFEHLKICMQSKPIYYI